MNASMKDIQSTPDPRGIAIDQVGITNLCYPISVMDQDGKLSANGGSHLDVRGSSAPFQGHAHEPIP